MAKPGLPHLLWSFWIGYYGTYYSSLYIAWFEESTFQAFLKSCPSNSLFYEAIFIWIASRQDKLSPEYLKNTFSTYFQGTHTHTHICFIDCLYVINNIYKYMFMKICVLLLREFSKWKSFLKWRMYIYMHIYIYIYINTHTYTIIYTHTHTYGCIHTYIHMHTYTHAYTHVCIHMHKHTYIYTCIHTHTYIHMHTYTHIYIHMHTHTHTHINLL